ILYAVLMSVLLGVTALALDLSALRDDRRTNRVAADAAAIAGSGAMGLTGGSPATGCLAAMRYAEVSLGITTPGADNCVSVFAGSASSMCTAGTARTATEALPTRPGATATASVYR